MVILSGHCRSGGSLSKKGKYGLLFQTKLRLNTVNYTDETIDVQVILTI